MSNLAGWQPMEIAPMDGTKVVVVGRILVHGDLDAFYGDTLRACVSAYHKDHETSPAGTRGWYWGSPGLSAGFDPIGWMPLPDVASMATETEP